MTDDQGFVSGWVLVPIDPTEAMIAAGIKQAEECTDDWSASAPCVAEHIWAAMLAVAPPSIQTPAESEGSPNEPRRLKITGELSDEEVKPL